MTENSSYLTAAKNVANELMTRNVSNWGTYAPPYSLGFTTGVWGYSFDYNFLMQMYAATGNSTYSNYAKAAWAWQKTNIPRFGNQTLLWNHYFADFSEPGYAAWMCGDWGLAALEMGDTAWANGMADVISSNMTALTTESITGNSGNNYPVLGMGEALKFFVTSSYASAKYASNITAMKTTLEFLQNPDGSWTQGDPKFPPCGKDVQTTAYAVMGLYAAGAYTYALKGANWLLSQQLSNGGWFEPGSTEYSEMDSEVTRALATEAPALPSLNVKPGTKTFWTPAYGKTFSVNVTLQNVINLYGYDFKLYWNTTLLDCIGFKTTIPTVWGAYQFAAENQTNEALGMYWLAVAAESPAPTFNGTTTLATLTFKITYDPIYPENVTSLFHLADTYLSDRNANAIPHTTVDGQYWLYSTKPTIAVSPSTVTAKMIETFSVNVTISNVVNLYNYEFTLSYNPALLYTLGLNVGTFLQQPQVYKSSINNTAGLITFGASSVAPAPSANGSGLLATITFKTVPIVWPSPSQNTTLQLSATLITNLGVIVPHSNINGFYKYTPIPGDLNSDGVVNLADLRIVAMAYGTTSGEKGWNPVADLNRDGVVDIFDLVLVSKNMGRTAP
jgi:hypothetical protein